VFDPGGDRPAELAEDRVVPNELRVVGRRCLTAERPCRFGEEAAHSTSTLSLFDAAAESMSSIGELRVHVTIAEHLP
jgi:hypothetical protein